LFFLHSALWTSSKQRQKQQTQHDVWVYVLCNSTMTVFKTLTVLML